MTHTAGFEPQTAPGGAWPGDGNIPRVGTRRTRYSQDKPWACEYSNCNHSFYERHTLLRHQTLKHGRQKKFSKILFDRT